MKRYSLRFKVFLVAGLCSMAGVILFWLSDDGRFDDYDMVQAAPDSSKASSGILDDWERFVPDSVLHWLGTMGNEAYEVRAFLPADQRATLGKILKAHDLLGEMEHKAPIPSNGFLGKFLLPIDGQAYLLVMYYGGPDDGNQEDDNIFYLSRVDVTRQGGILPVCDDQDMEGFRSGALYVELERFLQSLPVSSPARGNYDYVRSWWGDMPGESSPEGNEPGQ